MAVQFGSTGCSSITVEPFTPICSFTAPAGTTPLTFDVPVPHFAMPVPPNECQCFDFETGSDEADVTVVPACGTGKASCSVQIVKKDTDCCTGRYDIIPVIDVSVPCIPFTLAASTKTVNNRSGDATRGVDGEVTAFSVEQGTGTECCTIKSKLEIKLPDCVKQYDWTGVPTYDQIKYCDRGMQKTHQLITMVQDAANCSLYPKVTQLELPCCSLADETTSGSFSINGHPVAFTLTRTNCSYALSIGSVTIPTGLTCMPAIDLTEQKIKATYLDEDGEEQTAEAAIKFTSDNQACPTYTLSVGTLDLTGISAEASITNGGDVFQKKSGNNEGKLYIDGRLSGDDIWYGGGYGDVTPDAPTLTFSRGPIMGGRGNSTPPYGWVSIPVDEVSTKIVSANANGTVKGNNTMWRSTRPDADDVSNGGVESGLAGAATGDLSMVMPTGMQWHDRGIAMVLSHFMISDCGVLSSMHETGVAALVSPAPSVLTSDNTKNASGLAVYPAADDDLTTSGLAVKASDGLRIYGINDGKTPSADTDDATDRQGALEIQYGAGIRVIGNSSASGDSKYRSHPSTANGAIEINYGPGMNAVKTADSNGNITAFYDGAAALDGAIVPNAGRGLRLHGRTKMGSSETVSTTYKDQIEVYTREGDTGFDSDGKLAIYDKATSSECTIFGGSAYGDANTPFARGADCTIGVLTTTQSGGYSWAASGIYANAVSGIAVDTNRLSALSFNTATGSTNDTADLGSAILLLRDVVTSALNMLASFRCTNMHIAKSGVVIGIDGNYASSGISRHVTS